MGVLPYYGLYGEASPERGTFQDGGMVVYKRVGISIRELKQRRRRRQRQRQRLKTIGLMNKNNRSARAFWYISSLSSAKQQREMTKF